MKYVYEVRP